MTEDLATGVAGRVTDGGRRGGRVMRAAELPLIMDDDVAARLSTIGRTEDLVVSPDGRRLAVAGFAADRIALVEFGVERDPARGAPSAVLLSSVVFVDCEELAQPHGLAFVDDRTVLVANRAAELLLVELPAVGDGRAVAKSSGRVVIDGSSPVPVRTPGSVELLDAGSGLVEVMVCNNYANDVTRYVADTRDGFGLLDAEVLLRHRLDVPDGIAATPSAEWVAISNHGTFEVLLYRYDDRLGPDDEPHGVLSGCTYPHGLRFTRDGRYLVVADAGLPFVHVFESAGDWSGRREPLVSVRVMDDGQFLDGRHNPQEGGPKGLEIIEPAGVLAVTSEFQNLAFFDLAALGCTPPPAADPAARSAMSPAAGQPGQPGRSGQPGQPAGDGTPRRVVRRQAHRVATESGTLRSQLDGARAELDALRADQAWRAGVMQRCDEDITALNQQLRAANDRLADAGSTAAELQRRLDDAGTAIRELQSRLADADSTTADLRGRLAEAEAHAGRLQHGLDHACARVEDLETSTSWRLTAPLRALTGRIRRR